jgi:hypothetical protein
MTRPRNSLADRMLAAQVAIDNAISDTDVKTLVAEYGYDDTRLGEGKTMLDTANQLQQTQQKEYGDQYEATGALKQAHENADKAYMKFIKIARIALKSDWAAFKKLDLGGIRKKTFSGWMGQARQFYLNALSDSTVLEKMAVYGITLAKLEHAKVLLDETEAANAAQKKEKGEAQQATLERDKAIDSLEEWLSDFIVIARIAMEEKPQLLEKLGIVEPS